MKYPTDFDGWISQLDDDLSDDDLFALYMTVTTKENWYPFEIEALCEDCGRYSLVHADGGESVTIASDSAADLLLQMVAEAYREEGDIAHWYRTIWNDNP